MYKFLTSLKSILPTDRSISRSVHSSQLSDQHLLTPTTTAIANLYFQFRGLLDRFSLWSHINDTSAIFSMSSFSDVTWYYAFCYFHSRRPIKLGVSWLQRGLVHVDGLHFKVAQTDGVQFIFGKFHAAPIVGATIALFLRCVR